MSRLDRHISLVRGKLMLGRFLRGLAWSFLALAAVVWTAIMVDRLAHAHLPRQGLLLLIGCGVATIAGWAFMLWRNPTQKQAAVAIDEKLALKEKFSTALYARPLNDPFAMAAVHDAEQTAENVSLQKRFTVELPGRQTAGLAGAVAVVLLTYFLMPQLDLLGVKAAQEHKAQVARAEHVKAEKAVKQALAELEAAPKAVSDSESIKVARQDLSDMLKRPIDDPVGAQRKAASALQEMDSIRQKIEDQEKFAQAQNEMRALQSMNPSGDDKSPISQAQNAMIKGNFVDAVEQIKSAVNDFDKKSPEEQKQTAQAMAQLAQQIAQQANNPKVQQQIQQQLQQMGASQQQAQQMAQQMAAAANGDKAAQQQLQQAANQLAQQMNQQHGGSSQQQQQMAQQVQRAMQQMQQQANGQASAQQMSQAAQQLAQAMQQSAGLGQQQGQQGQQAGQGSQQQQQQQQMAQAGQAMQQQLQQMQAMANAAQAGAANSGSQSGSQSQGGGGQQANNPGGGQQAGSQSGQWAANDNQNQAQGGGGGGGHGGARPDPVEAPFGVKQEVSESQTNENGKILASSFVKAGSIKGESKLGLADAVVKEQQDAADEVDEDRIPRAASEAVKNYFQTIKDDAK